MQDLSSRLSNRVRLSTDGNRFHPTSVEPSFGAGVDYGMVIKMA